MSSAEIKCPLCQGRTGCDCNWCNGLGYAVVSPTRELQQVVSEASVLRGQLSKLREMPADLEVDARRAIELLEAHEATALSQCEVAKNMERMTSAHALACSQQQFLFVRQTLQASLRRIQSLEQDQRIAMKIGTEDMEAMTTQRDHAVVLLKRCALLGEPIRHMLDAFACDGVKSPYPATQKEARGANAASEGMFDLLLEIDQFLNPQPIPGPAPEVPHG